MPACPCCAPRQAQRAQRAPPALLPDLVPPPALLPLRARLVLAPLLPLVPPARCSSGTMKALSGGHAPPGNARLGWQAKHAALLLAFRLHKPPTVTHRPAMLDCTAVGPHLAAPRPTRPWPPPRTPGPRRGPPAAHAHPAPQPLHSTHKAGRGSARRAIISNAAGRQPRGCSAAQVARHGAAHTQTHHPACVPEALSPAAAGAAAGAATPMRSMRAFMARSRSSFSLRSFSRASSSRCILARASTADRAFCSAAQ